MIYSLITSVDTHVDVMHLAWKNCELNNLIRSLTDSVLGLKMDCEDLINRQEVVSMQETGMTGVSIAFEEYVNCDYK